MEPKRETPNALIDIQQELINREPLFHRPEFGCTRQAFEAMIVDDFWETGASGRRYSRESVIDLLVKRYERQTQDEWRTENFYCQEICPNNYLLTYTLHQGTRVTRRATLWRRQASGWIAVYHQGTMVENP